MPQDLDPEIEKWMNDRIAASAIGAFEGMIKGLQKGDPGTSMTIYQFCQMLERCIKDLETMYPGARRAT